MDDESTPSRVERSLLVGYWLFPLEPTSDEICTALRARHEEHYEDGYPDNLVSLNRFFVMHKVGYRNGKGVKLEGWKTYDDNLMTKTSSGPLNGNDDLVLRIFALRPVIKGVEPIKLCWVKELSKGHKSGRRKKIQPEEENGQKKLKITHSPPSNLPLTPSSPPNTTTLLLPYHDNDTNASSQQESHSKQTNAPLPGLHITLAEIAGTLAPIHLPPLETASSSSSSPHPKTDSTPAIQSNPAPEQSTSLNPNSSSTNSQPNNSSNYSISESSIPESSISNSPLSATSSSNPLPANTLPTNSLDASNPNPDALNSNINLYSSFYVHNQH
eukprot:Phypoly_transcript_12753.p1 GENE.Phypoly_transcript_12753~~Phypoly_transcript_12753.p1  ORF type:complete len:328 (+),score=56.67 Phypoly_transcript_12753:104-1087(+)